MMESRSRARVVRRERRNPGPRPPGPGAGFTALGLAALSLAALVGAAPAAGQEWSLGFRAGMTVSTVAWEDPNLDSQMALRLGPHFGVTGALELGRFAEADASLLLNRVGFHRAGGYPTGLALDYLELPVQLRLRLPWRVAPHVSVGAAPRVRLRCRLTDVGIVGTAACDDPVVGARWRATGTVALVGLGASLRIGRGTLVVDAALGLGTGTLKEDPLPPGWARSVDIRVSGAYRLPGGTS